MTTGPRLSRAKTRRTDSDTLTRQGDSRHQPGSPSSGPRTTLGQQFEERRLEAAELVAPRDQVAPSVSRRRTSDSTSSISRSGRRSRQSTSVLASSPVPRWRQGRGQKTVPLSRSPTSITKWGQTSPRSAAPRSPPRLGVSGVGAKVGVDGPVPERPRTCDPGGRSRTDPPATVYRPAGDTANQGCV